MLKKIIQLSLFLIMLPIVALSTQSDVKESKAAGYVPNPLIKNACDEQVSYDTPSDQRTVVDPPEVYYMVDRSKSISQGPNGAENTREVKRVLVEAVENQYVATNKYDPLSKVNQTDSNFVPWLDPVKASWAAIVPFGTHSQPKGLRVMPTNSGFNYGDLTAWGVPDGNDVMDTYYPDLKNEKWPRGSIRKISNNESKNRLKAAIGSTSVADPRNSGMQFFGGAANQARNWAINNDFGVMDSPSFYATNWHAALRGLEYTDSYIVNYMQQTGFARQFNEAYAQADYTGAKSTIDLAVMITDGIPTANGFAFGSYSNDTSISPGYDYSGGAATFDPIDLGRAKESVSRIHARGIRTLLVLIGNYTNEALLYAQDAFGLSGEDDVIIVSNFNDIAQKAGNKIAKLVCAPIGIELTATPVGTPIAGKEFVVNLKACNTKGVGVKEEGRSAFLNRVTASRSHTASGAGVTMTGKDAGGGILQPTDVMVSKDATLYYGCFTWQDKVDIDEEGGAISLRYDVRGTDTYTVDRYARDRVRLNYTVPPAEVQLPT